jgi:hypothetical protein
MQGWFLNNKYLIGKGQFSLSFFAHFLVVQLNIYGWNDLYNNILLDLGFFLIVKFLKNWYKCHNSELPNVQIFGYT